MGCWAHARRKFYESLETAPDEASTVMVGIRRLYAVEAEAKERRCLMCGESFPSTWPGDRVCRRCRSSAAWRQG